MIQEFRLVLNVDDFETALEFYRALNLEVVESWDSADGRGAILELPRATLEIMDRKNAKSVDALEAGVHECREMRLGLKVENLQDAVEYLERQGAKVISKFVKTLWGSFNQRLETPDAKQLTVFQETRV
jgi:catechol 2,3-dioxygenase-like lactoylglutathione lyase family enzyme